MKKGRICINSMSFSSSPMGSEVFNTVSSFGFVGGSWGKGLLGEGFEMSNWGRGRVGYCFVWF